ncbi:hypothetical protein B0H14DRAFT_2586211 [Mycena olivaceomarginata]|nr:hypothetical protein B0H14DRAFT_2586211 [Mycena olivaceomarginata]
MPAGGHLSAAKEAHYARASLRNCAVPLRASDSGWSLLRRRRPSIRTHPVAKLRTYHCARVRKMLLSGLDPSMLIGFIVRDEGDCSAPSSRFRTSHRRGAAWTTTTVWSSRASWTRRKRRMRISTAAAICRARRPPT